MPLPSLLPQTRLSSTIYFFYIFSLIRIKLLSIDTAIVTTMVDARLNNLHADAINTPLILQPLLISHTHFDNPSEYSTDLKLN